MAFSFDDLLSLPGSADSHLSESGPAHRFSHSADNLLDFAKLAMNDPIRYVISRSW